MKKLSVLLMIVSLFPVAQEGDPGVITHGWTYETK